MFEAGAGYNDYRIVESNIRNDVQTVPLGCPSISFTWHGSYRVKQKTCANMGSVYAVSRSEICGHRSEQTEMIVSIPNEADLD